MDTQISQRLILFIISLSVLAINSPPALQTWVYDSNALLPIPLNATLIPIPAPKHTDLDLDGSPEYIRLRDGNLGIYEDPAAAEPLWVSPAEWQVWQAEISDFNRDGIPEVTLLVWRPHVSWPIDTYIPNPGRIQDFHDRRGQSCHLILIGWKRGAYRELWAGSALAEPLRSFAAADVDADGFQDLIALETRYDDPAFLPARALALWEWNGFGFTLLARQQGSFHMMMLVKSLAEENIILIQQ
jgi:hypothetical protein